MRKPPGSDESKELFLTLQDAQKVAIRQKLLQCLQNEGLPHVRHKVGDAVAEIARQYTDDSMCPQALYQISQRNTAD